MAAAPGERRRTPARPGRVARRRRARSDAGRDAQRHRRGRSSVAETQPHVAEAPPAEPSRDIPTASEIEHDHSSVESTIDGAPSASGNHPDSVHHGSVAHSVPPAGMDAVEDATPVERVERDVTAIPDVNLGEASE